MANLSTSSRAGRALLIVLSTLLVPLACSDASDVVLLEIEGAGVLFGQAFLDTDASGGLSGADTPIAGVDVVLLTATTGQVADRATTDSLGVFTLFEVPVGSYLISLDSAALSDSVAVLDDSPVTVSVGDTARVDVGVSYPILTLEEALASTVGNRVFTSGIVLNPRLNFDPTGQVHLKGESLYLRTLNMARIGINGGDSVRVLGRVVTDNGRVALDDVTAFRLVPQAELISPVDVSVADGAMAAGGALDAALARIENVEITDTSTAVDGHFRFWAVDGTDSIEVVLRDFLGFNTSVVRPDTILNIRQASGLLTPFDDAGMVRWRLLPRAPSDVILEVRLADVSVTAALDTVQASLGDTVEVTVVAANVGPFTARGLEVQDTIPTALSYVSSTATTGSYDDATGVWAIGDLSAGAADTLVIRMEVSDGTPALIGNIAESLGLVTEVDPNVVNNGVIVFLTIS